MRVRIESIHRRRRQHAGPPRRAAIVRHAAERGQLSAIIEGARGRGVLVTALPEKLRHDRLHLRRVVDEQVAPRAQGDRHRRLALIGSARGAGAGGGTRRQEIAGELLTGPAARSASGRSRAAARAEGEGQHDGSHQEDQRSHDADEQQFRDQTRLAPWRWPARPATSKN